MFGLALIAVLVIMGGAIAYIGDWLGSKVGKRKLTIFGLRPKHTSILFAVATGAIIAGSTLGVMSIVSRDVRTALFGMEALKAELTGLSREVAVKNVELDASRAALETKTKEYAAVSAKIAETTAKLDSVTDQLAAAAAERDRTAAALEKAQRDYAAAKKDIDALQATKEELDGKVARLSAARNQLQADVDRLNELTVNLSKGMRIIREGVVVYRAGEVIITAVTKGGRSPEEAGQILASIIGGANQAILNRLDVADKNAEALWIAKAEFDQAAALIAAAREDVIVRVLAAGNTVYGEPVIGRLELYANRLIYAAGETVLAATVDVGADGKKAEEAVMRFLQQVNARAVDKGILPDPLQGTVGALSGAQFFETVNKVKRAGGLVELAAVTKGDIYTAGPLQIEIKARGLPNQ